MTFPLFDLSGRRALVTGSSQGIGRALADGLAEHGFSWFRRNAIYVVDLKLEEKRPDHFYFSVPLASA